jgi:hypothetical protein
MADDIGPEGPVKVLVGGCKVHAYLECGADRAESGSKYGTGAVGVWEFFWKEVAGGAAFPSISELRQTALGRYRIWRNWGCRTLDFGQRPNGVKIMKLSASHRCFLSLLRNPTINLICLLGLLYN